jgi:hypothetical protein
MVSESRITVTGATGTETYLFPNAIAGWFTKPNDAHADFTLRTAPGQHPAQLGLQWDGKGPSYKITAANNDDVGGDNRFTFSSTWVTGRRNPEAAMSSKSL